MKAWIRIVPFGEATGKLKRLYERIRTPSGHIDNIMRVHSLRPHTLDAHMTLYKNVLHHAGNQLPTWLLESVGVYVSLLNGCDYCVEHHFVGLQKLLEEERAQAIRRALETSSPEDAFSGRELAVMRYAAALTCNPAELTQELVEGMREAGLSDGEILEVNQVTSYFAYANRTVLGLGVSLQGDILGLSPGDSDNPDNWQHQ